MTDDSKRLGKSLEHKTMAAAATAELRRRILEGTLPAGTQLRQSNLAQELGISRIPLREAFLQLEAEGLVRINAHRGATVSTLTREEVDELFELRAAIEPVLLVRSAPHLTSQDYARLHALLDDFSEALHSGDVRRWGEFNAEFHRLLYHRADRPRFMALAANLLQECDRHTRTQLTLTGAMERAEDEHAEILRLCEARRIDAAAALLKDHILHVQRSLQAIVTK